MNNALNNDAANANGVKQAIVINLDYLEQLKGASNIDAINDVQNAWVKIRQFDNFLDVVVKANVSLTELTKQASKIQFSLNVQSDINRVKEIDVKITELESLDLIVLPSIAADAVKAQLKTLQSEKASIFEKYETRAKKLETLGASKSENVLSLDKLKALNPIIANITDVENVLKQGFKISTIAKYLGYPHNYTNRDAVVKHIASTVKIPFKELMQVSYKY